METDVALDALLTERRALLARIEEEREQLERMRSIVARVEERLAHDETTLGEIDSALGRAPQLRLEESDVRLRGRRLEQIAVEVLERERGPGVEIHYKEWFELLREHGYLVSGKEPLNTFLAQINRSAVVESTGKRSGRYKVKSAA